MKTKVDPNQNVSPTQTTHVGSDGRSLTGASMSSGGGIPLRLSLATAVAGHMANAAIVVANTHGLRMDDETLVWSAFNLADALIEKYNADLEAPARPVEEAAPKGDERSEK